MFSAWVPPTSNRIERKQRHPTSVWCLMKAPTAVDGGSSRHVRYFYEDTEYVIGVTIAHLLFSGTYLPRIRALGLRCR
jgi:hypothetical protein